MTNISRRVNAHALLQA